MGFKFIVLLVVMNPIIRLDHRLTFWLQSWPTSLHPLMIAITQLGSVGLIVSLSVVIAVLAFAKHHSRLMWAFAAVLPGEAFNALLKLGFNRARPHTQYAQDMFLRTKSFPSGHAFGSMLFYGLLAYLAFTRLPQGWNYLVSALFVILIFLIGVSRVYLGAHYSLDVIGGWVIGAIVLFIIIKLTKI